MVLYDFDAGILGLNCGRLNAEYAACMTECTVVLRCTRIEIVWYKSLGYIYYGVRV